MTTPSAERLAAGLREQSRAFAEAVDGADPEGPVPTCPEWTMRELVLHVGRAHRWATEFATGRADGPQSLAPPEEEPKPEQWAAWLREGAERLAGEGLHHADDEVWTFLGPRRARFWLRRILHDTSVHHADAALALDKPYTLADDLAEDAISEGLDLIAWPGAARQRPRIAELRGTGQTLRLQPLDGEGWLITRTPSGITWRRGRRGGDVVLSGQVSQLLLVFSRRLPPDDPRTKITGDRALLDHWLARTAF